MQLTGVRVALGVRGVAAGQRAVEVARPDRVELVGQLVVGDAALDQRERLARRGRSRWCWRRSREIADVPGSARGSPSARGGVRAAHPAVAVPLGLAVAEPHAVHHAVADEPVVELGVDLADRVRAVAKVSPVQVVRDRPVTSRSERVLLLSGANSPSR